MPCADALLTYRGAVRPPFIEGVDDTTGQAYCFCYRGAVRPPFIEGLGGAKIPDDIRAIGGQSAPPSLKGDFLLFVVMP